MKKRLDLYSLEIGLFESREKAKRHIMAGEVLVNGQVVTDASFNVRESDRIELRFKMPYVSRGGLKLESALRQFDIVLKDKVCLDIGVATGGFSDCMLSYGARKVYGVDVGKGQVSDKLLKNERFVFIPYTNARFLKRELFNDNIDFAAVDVSFISLKLIIPPLLSCLNKNSLVVVLVKPQFELARGEVVKGIVKDENLRKKALNGIIEFLNGFKFLKIINWMESPVRGIKGNREFLLYFKIIEDMI